MALSDPKKDNNRQNMAQINKLVASLKTNIF